MATHNEFLNFLTGAYAVKPRHNYTHCFRTYQTFIQFRNCIPRRGPIRAVTSSGTRTFRLRIPIAPRLHISSAAAVVVPVPWVILSIAILLGKRLTRKVRGFPTSRINLHKQIATTTTTMIGKEMQTSSLQDRFWYPSWQGISKSIHIQNLRKQHYFYTTSTTMMVMLQNCQ